MVKTEEDCALFNNCSHISLLNIVLTTTDTLASQPVKCNYENFYPPFFSEWPTEVCAVADKSFGDWKLVVIFFFFFLFPSFLGAHLLLSHFSLHIKLLLLLFSSSGNTTCAAVVISPISPPPPTVLFVDLHFYFCCCCCWCLIAAQLRPKDAFAVVAAVATAIAGKLRQQQQ